MRINLKLTLLLSGLLLFSCSSMAESLKDEYIKSQNKAKLEKEQSEKERNSRYQEGADLANRIYAQNKILMCGYDTKYIYDELKKTTAEKAEYLSSRRYSYDDADKEGPLIGSITDSLYGGSNVNDGHIFVSFIDNYLIALEMSVADFNSYKGYQGNRLLQINTMRYLKATKTTKMTKNYETKPTTKTYSDWLKIDSSKIVKWTNEENDTEYKGIKVINSRSEIHSYELRPDELVYFSKYELKTYPDKKDGFINVGKRECMWIDFYFNKLDGKHLNN